MPIISVSMKIAVHTVQPLSKIEGAINTKKPLYVHHADELLRSLFLTVSFTQCK